MRRRTRRAARPGRAGPAGLADPRLVQKRSEFAFETGKWSIEELTSGNDDDIKACGRFPMSEQLPNQAFGAVTDDCAADLAGGGNS